MPKIIKSFRKLARQEIYPQTAVGLVVGINSDGTLEVELKDGGGETVTMYPPGSGESIYANYTVDLVRSSKNGRWKVIGRSSAVWVAPRVIRG